MNNKNKYLIIPDIHGRTFWKDALEDHPIDEFEKVIFLGDYLDPYPFEGVTVRDAIENFKEIIKFKSEHQDKVILLLGNHDFYYFIKHRGPSRYAWQDKDEIEMIFEDDRDLFQYAYETENTLFTHAGFLDGWKVNVSRFRDRCEPNKITFVAPTADSINSLAMKPEGYKFMDMVSRERGGHSGYGSPIWADYHEHFWNHDYEGKFQVFGHTLQLNTLKYYETNDPDDISDGEEVIEENFAMLDCRHAFIYYEDEREFTKLIKFENKEIENV